MNEESRLDTVSMLSRTVVAANQYLSKCMQRSGLTGLVTSHGDILVQLFKEDGLSMGEIAQRIDRDPSTVTTLVKKLIASGYVKTERNPKDRRTTVVLLTNEGRALEDVFWEISQQLNEVQNEGIPDEDIQTTRRVLEKMQANFRAID